jgi:DNA-binding beta-propeller fold protein YncE
MHLGMWYSFLVAFVLTCGSSAHAEAQYNLTPVFHSSIGKLAPLEYYAIAVTVDQDGNVYLVDLYRKTVQKRSGSGDLLLEFSLQDKWPRNVSIDHYANLYTIDALGCKVRKYSPEGDLLLTWGSKSDLPGGFHYPQGIAINQLQQVIVVDDTTQISAFDGEGTLLWNNMDTVFPSGKLKRPQAVTVGPDGFIYVADSGNNRIAKFDSEGNFVKALNSTTTLQAPVGIAVASDGTILVHNRKQFLDNVGEPQIYKFSPEGELLLTWGKKGRGAGELWEAHGIGIAPDDTLWVAGYHGHNVVHYDLHGNLLDEWNDHNIVGGKFAQVLGTAVGKDGKIYVVDFWNQVVQVFDRYGNFEFMWGERGQGNWQCFNFPRYMNSDHDGNIYVSDDHEVRKFDENGEFLDTIKLMSYPKGIAVESTGRVWIAEGGNSQIRRYNELFELDLVIGSDDLPGGLNSPYGICQGPNGMIYVADTFNHRMIRLDQNANFDMAWGGYGNQHGQFMAPVGLAIDSQGRVYVSESWGNRIQVFTSEGIYLTGWAGKEIDDIEFENVYDLALDGDYFLYAPDHGIKQGIVNKFALIPEFQVYGKPDYAVGEDLGYFIWSDDGRTWHIRWTANSVEHTFEGVVHSTSPFVGVNIVDRESEYDSFSTSSHSVSFSTMETNGEDGLDLVVANDGIITFELNIDSIPIPHLVKIGAGDNVPTSLPLPLITKEADVINQIGRPSYTAAQDAGYYLWQDTNDEEWHLRWSGDSIKTYSYAGILTTGSGFLNAETYSFESNDEAQIDSTVINFDAYAGAGEDGIDFYTLPGAQVSFELYIDKVKQQDMIYIGQAGTNPTQIPFSLLAVGPVEDLTTIGRPSYTAAEDSGYFLWQDADDRQWHLRWSGDSVHTYYYTGTLMSSGGFTDVEIYSYEWNDELQVDTMVISFSAHAGAGEDGIDFFVPSGSQISFELYIDEIEQPEMVHVGRTGIIPGNIPFTITGLPACIADFDSDSDVDGSDLCVFAVTNTDPNFDRRCDFDNDRDVDGRDLAIFSAEFGKTDCQ